MILNACVRDNKMVDENICKNCKDGNCRHAGQPTTAERLDTDTIEGGSKMCNKRYYLTQRPPAPGTFPGKPVEIKAFDSKGYVGEIGCRAWGWVEYKEPLSQEQVDDYELVE